MLLHRQIASRVEEWRYQGYPCVEYSAITESTNMPPPSST